MEKSNPYPILTSPEFESLLESLFNLQRFGIKLGLEHTFSLLDTIENPHNELILIHIAGTNGKGSTSAMISSILRESGKKVGLYTSPHLIRFNERIRVNGIPISNNEIISFMEKAGEAISRIESTFFEATSVMALDYFKNQNVDVAIIETGLGGRLDSTNVIIPALTVMTPISMDHMDILGENLEKIAHEKAGILKKGIPLVTANQTKIAQSILQRKADQLQVELFQIEKVSQILVRESGTEFLFKNKKYRTSLLGEHQAHNAALAVESIHQFDASIDERVIEKGLTKVLWPGRIQPVGERLFFDVAHNEDGIESLINTIKIIYPNGPIIGLFCLKGDKEFSRLIQKMEGQFNSLYVTTDQNDLLLGVEDLSEKLNNLGLKNEPILSVTHGLKKLKEKIKTKGVGLIFGSHYIAEEVYRALEIPFDKSII